MKRLLFYFLAESQKNSLRYLVGFIFKSKTHGTRLDLKFDFSIINKPYLEAVVVSSKASGVKRQQPLKLQTFYHNQQGGLCEKEYSNGGTRTFHRQLNFTS
jgi:hypothetical protein